MESDGRKDIQEKKMMTCSVPLSKLKNMYICILLELYIAEKETTFIAKQ